MIKSMRTDRDVIPPGIFARLHIRRRRLPALKPLRVLVSFLVMAAAFPRSALCSCYDVFAAISPPPSSRSICTSNTCLWELEMFRAAIFIPQGNGCSDECTFTNATVTVTGGVLMSYNPNPPQMPPGGGLVVFDCVFRQTPGATNATVTIQTPCINVGGSFNYPELILLTLQLQDQPAKARLCWNTLINTMYQVQHKADLNAETWDSVGDPVTGDGTTSCVLDPETASGFYRVIILQ